MVRPCKPLFVLTLMASAMLAGCGWSNHPTRQNGMTGISESGYPKGAGNDFGSPALGSQERAHKPGEGPEKDHVRTLPEKTTDPAKAESK